MDNLRRLSIEEFYNLHKEYITPLNIKIDIDQFQKDIEVYKPKFRQWGIKHTNFPRYGLALTNLDGNIDGEVDPCCYPLDQWWEQYPDKKYWESDFKVATSVLDIPSLQPLQQIKQYLWRSAILMWHNTGHFKPHVDMYPETITHLRLWGTNKTGAGYRLTYGKKRIKDWEPGRLYLINTLDEHEAFSIENDTYTFFIAVSLDAIPWINESIIQFQKAQNN